MTEPAGWLDVHAAHYILVYVYNILYIVDGYGEVSALVEGARRLCAAWRRQRTTTDGARARARALDWTAAAGRLALALARALAQAEPSRSIVAECGPSKR